MRTACVIAGGGPAGAVLALMLARGGVEVTLLEKHGDFLRDFRGDTIHPSTLQLIDELGLAEEFHKLPHRKAYGVSVETDQGTVSLADLRRLPGKYRYIAFVPQWDFLNLIISEARRYPTFRLLMNAEAHGIVREGDRVRGLRYRTPGGEHEIRAELTIGADGRHSDVRRAALLRPREFGAPMDVAWFRLPRVPSDREDTFLRLAAGRPMVAINRGTYWQLALLFPKDGFEALKAQGIASLRRTVAELMPFLADRVAGLSGFDDISMLQVKLNRLRRWHRPGLLCIGDAAHAMSPVFGIGINLAIQDAVATANLLGPALLRGEPIPESLLARVQRRRAFSAAVVQFAQRVVQDRIIRPALAGSSRPIPIPPDVSRVPVLSDALARFVSVGVLPEHARFGNAAERP
ncbi:FAD-dependent oxidoreductase [Thermopolyspora sp. NPDC052614]|uniref:FAD-dependent oxidoreductase n=1 Tax=Thermopolyspora sp. NPDC052614 TaxID=3155682 RepID=UPI0034205DCF